MHAAEACIAKQRLIPNKGMAANVIRSTAERAVMLHKLIDC